MSAADKSGSDLEEMTCKELVEVVSDYIENRLSEEDRMRFEAHLEQCPYCVTYLAQMRETIATLGKLNEYSLIEDSISPEARGRLLAAFRNWRR